MNEDPVQSQFVQVGERRVFLRHAGSGPAVVLVHQSPESSVSLLPWFAPLAPHFAVFAPDTPGFGLSDPLPLAQPTIPDLAAALGRLLQALHLPPVLLYGVHTGAAIAARLALDQPQRVAALVCDGLSAFNAAERRPLLDGYLPPFEPQWDGTHLLWLWARMREQKLFFPWQAGTQATRIPYPLPSPAQIQKEAMELLDAGDGYRAGYRAPLLYEHSAASAALLTVPARLLYRRSDVLRPHMDRLPPLLAQVVAQEVADAGALQQQAIAFLLDQASHRRSAVSSVENVTTALSPSRRLVRTPSGLVLAWHLALGDTEVTELMLPDIGTPAAIAVDRRVGMQALTLELPGHGASSPGQIPHIQTGEWLHDLKAALHTLGVRRLHLRARGGSCAFAVSLAQLLAGDCLSLELTDPLPLNDAERAQFLSSLPLLEPDANGSHFIAAWNWARLRSLFWPWLPPQDPAALIMAAAPPPLRVHGEVVEILRAGPAWRALWVAALNTPLAAELAALMAPSATRTPPLLRLLAAPANQPQLLLLRLRDAAPKSPSQLAVEPH